MPSDYASLVIRTEPDIGGDTLWASAYEAYDRLSPAYQKFLEGLTALHKGVGFLDLAKRANISPLRENRGSPENVGQDLETVHPVIRTNPVTGWKGVFVNRGFTQRIVELSKPESDKVLEFLYTTISANHDLQVRFRWEKDSLAIWDNRSSFHTATEVSAGLRLLMVRILNTACSARARARSASVSGHTSTQRRLAVARHSRGRSNECSLGCTSEHKEYSARS